MRFKIYCMRARPFASLLLLAALVGGCATANAADPDAATDGSLDAYAAGPDTSAGIDPYAAAEPYASLDSYASPDPYASRGPYASTAPGAYGSAYPNASPSAQPTPEPVYAVPVASSLAIAKVSARSSGVWLWKRCSASVEVENPTRGPLSGELSVTFTRDGAAVETVTDFVEDLAPGKTHRFTAKSTKRADDAEAAVDTAAK